MKSLGFLVAVLLLFGSTQCGPVQSAKTNQLQSEQCKACDFLVALLHNLWGDKIFEDCLMDLVIAICDAFKLEDHFVCRLMVKDFEDMAMYVIGEVIVEPHEICGNWTVPIPGTAKPYQPLPAPTAGKPKLNVLHLTDIHVDMYYEEGSEADCGEPLCCRGDKNPVEVGASATTKAPIKHPAGYWGTVMGCDIPYRTFTNMLDHIAANHKNIDYILVSGDLESHADWDYTRTTHQNMVKNISESIRSRFPNIPAYFSIGNHEGVPIDVFAPRFTPERFHMDWLYDTMADSWKGWVPADQDANMRYMGSYVVKPYPGLRIISVNTPLGGDPVNAFLYINQTDPDGTMSWLIAQLYAAEQAGDKVHVTAHIPGGDGECLEGWAINYYKVMNRFANIITGQFFGHTHSEQFYMIYSDPEDAKSTPTGVIFSAGSATTMSNFNPVYRLYTLDGNYPGSTFGILDWEEWFFDLSKNTDATKHDWTQLYASVLQEYGLKNNNPSEWNSLINRMKTDEDLFKKYRKNYYRRTDLGPCDQKCRHKLLCSARQAHHSENLCSDLSSYDPSDIQAPFYRKPPSQYVPTMADYERIKHEVRADDDQCKR
ncbi:unnamed protein product, partial [Mesorhabditis spiculigera]